MKPRAAIAEITRLIQEREISRHDEWALRRIEECCASLRTHRANAAKLAEIQTYAREYFSGDRLEPQRYRHLAIWIENACGFIESKLSSD